MAFSKTLMLLTLCCFPSILSGSEKASITTIKISNIGRNPEIAIHVSENSRLKQPMFESFEDCEFYLFKLYKEYYLDNDEYEAALLSTDNPRQLPFLFTQRTHSKFKDWRVCVDLDTLKPYVE